MIKINLLGNDTAKDNTGKLIAVGYIASVVAVVLISTVLHMSITSRNQNLAEVVVERKEELEQLEKKTAEVKEMAKKEGELKNKLAVIATLKKQKKGPVKILDQLNSAIPEKAWLIETREKDGAMRMEGFALDNQTISQFLKGLMVSEFFPKVELDETKLVEKSGVKVSQFVVKAEVSYAGKIAQEQKVSDQEKSTNEK